MGYDSAENSSPVAGEECDSNLSYFRVVFLRFGREWDSIHPSYGFLESDKLYDGIWNLSAPKRNKSLVHTSPSLILHDLIPCSSKIFRETSCHICLHSDFHGFEGAEESICNYLSTSRGDRPSNCFVLVCVLFTDDSLVHVLENFIETKFSKSLSWIADKCRLPTDSQSFESLSGFDSVESISHGFINIRIYLKS